MPQHATTSQAFSSRLLLLVGCALCLFTTCTSPPPPTPERLALSIEQALDTLLNAWYPRSIDTEHGGFHSHFAYDWTPIPQPGKHIVAQSRLTWTASQAAARFPNDTLFSYAAAQGARYLRDQLWDAKHGGFHEQVNPGGTALPSERSGTLKTAYGQAFGIFALSTHAWSTGDSLSLLMAQQAFRWLDDHAYDQEYGGYFRLLERDGTPLLVDYDGRPPKGANSTLHIMEALTALYQVWPDPLVHTRLLHTLRLLRDRISSPEGSLRQSFQRDWTALSYSDSSKAVQRRHLHLDHILFGHDLEAAYLMREAAQALGVPDEMPMLRSKRMVEYAWRYGWDTTRGGFYDWGMQRAGEQEITIVRKKKAWWAQAEGLATYAYLLQHDPENAPRHFERMVDVWTYIETYLLDPVHGGWYAEGIDRTPAARKEAKGHAWKADYHATRALMKASKALRYFVSEQQLHAAQP